MAVRRLAPTRPENVGPRQVSTGSPTQSALRLLLYARCMATYRETDLRDTYVPDDPRNLSLVRRLAAPGWRLLCASCLMFSAPDALLSKSQRTLPSTCLSSPIHISKK